MGCSSSVFRRDRNGSQKRSSVSKLDSGIHKKRSIVEIAPPLEVFNGDDKNNVLGLLNVRIGQAKLSKVANYNVTLSMGLQSFLSHTRPKSNQPVFDVDYNVVLQESGEHVLHFMVHRIRQLDAFSHTNVGVGEIDLKRLVDGSDRDGLRKAGTVLVEDTEIDLFDPVDVSRKVGSLQISVRSTAPAELENNFWHRLLALVDYDESETLDFDEFAQLMNALTGVDQLSPEKLRELWHQACGDSDDVDVDALCALLTQTEDENGLSLIQTCPLSGRELNRNDRFGSIVYMTLVMDGGLGRNLQGGFRTASQANRGWMMQMSEWAVRSSHDPGLNVGANAAHIIVYDRVRKILTEEVISAAVVHAMRNMYQTSLGRLMRATGAFKLLKNLSEERGRLMNDPASKADIQRFIRGYKGQVDLGDILEPLDSFQNFNEFFYRKLKPEARPIALPDDPAVLVSAADCRLMAFEAISDATLFWIKGSHFSIRGLLADKKGVESAKYDDGVMVIFRLAPQDYHRFHAPCNCTLQSIEHVPGQLYTVNPIAINSHFADVFTENKRDVATLVSPEFGEVKFVAIGATLVGSIVWTAEVGQQVQKGQELGYFAFGGSTVICLFQNGRVVLDDDLVSMSRKSIETFVKMGVHIGKCPGNLHPDEESDFHVPPAVEASANTVSTKFLQSDDRTGSARVEDDSEQVAARRKPGLHGGADVWRQRPARQRFHTPRAPRTRGRPGERRRLGRVLNAVRWLSPMTADLLWSCTAAADLAQSSSPHGDSPAGHSDGLELLSPDRRTPAVPAPRLCADGPRRTP